MITLTDILFVFSSFSTFFFLFTPIYTDLSHFSLTRPAAWDTIIYGKRQHNYIISVGEVTTGIGIFDMLQAFDRTRRLLPRDCGDTISWSAGCVEKAQPNAIDMPCDTKA